MELENKTPVHCRDLLASSLVVSFAFLGINKCLVNESMSLSKFYLCVHVSLAHILEDVWKGL